MLENVAGLMEPKFAEYRKFIDNALTKLGYDSFWKLYHASDYGVPQLRPWVIIIALRPKYAKYFNWPDKVITAPTVGESLYDLMTANGWLGVKQWKEKTNKITQP